VLAALVWMRNGDRRRAQIVAARAGRVLGTVLIAGSLALVFAGQDLIFTALVGWFVLSASAREESSARLLRTLEGRTAGELMRPIAHTAPEWSTVAAFGPIAEPTLLLGWDGTPTALLPPGAVFAVPPEAREQVQLRSLGQPLSGFRAESVDAQADEVVARGLPVLVRDAEGRPVGLLGFDELKIAAKADPVLARSAR
jgi:hypothetical protein